jgi:hypothetical protein
VREHNLPSAPKEQRQLIARLARELAGALRTCLGENATCDGVTLKTVVNKPSPANRRRSSG